jgi:rRNA maturation endonuclease Nob1
MDSGPCCCDQAHKWIEWRKPDQFQGPQEEGWCIIIHAITRSPEFSNINFCPFCGGQFVKQMFKKPV